MKRTIRSIGALSILFVLLLSSCNVQKPEGGENSMVSEAKSLPSSAEHSSTPSSSAAQSHASSVTEETRSQIEEDTKEATSQIKENTQSYPDYLVENPEQENYVYLETEHTLAEKEGTVHEWYLDQLYPIAGTTIDHHGKLLLANMPKDASDTATLYLANVEDQSMTPIHTAADELHFCEMYHDEEIIVFYEYKMWQSISNPLTYYIYHQADGTFEIIDVSEFSLPPERNDWNLDSYMARLEDDLYFELQHQETVYQESPSGNELVSAGVGIYRYNLKSKTVEYLADGFLPRVLGDEIVYIKDKTDTLVRLSDGQTVAEKVSEYSTYQDTMVIQRDNPINHQMETYYYKDGKEEKVLSRDASRPFWKFRLNDRYIVWYQTSSSLYLYSIRDKEVLLVSSKEGARTADISEKYLFWYANEYTEFDMSATKATLQYVKFEDESSQHL